MTTPKDVMKKAEEYAIDHKDENCCFGNYCEDHQAGPVIETFKAGYLKAMELHEAETKMLCEAIEKSIAIADDYADSGISKPIREALALYRSRGTKET